MIFPKTANWVLDDKSNFFRKGMAWSGDIFLRNRCRDGVNLQIPSHGIVLTSVNGVRNAEVVKFFPLVGMTSISAKSS